MPKGFSSKAKRRCRQAMLDMAARNKDRPRCAYCNAAVSAHIICHRDQPQMHGNVEVFMFTIDHVWPRGNGGTNHPRNMLPACEPCNSRRGDRPLDVFIASLGDRAAMTVEQARRHMTEAKAVVDAHSWLQGPGR